MPELKVTQNREADSDHHQKDSENLRHLQLVPKEDDAEYGAHDGFQRSDNAGASTVRNNVQTFQVDHVGQHGSDNGQSAKAQPQAKTNRSD